MASSDHDSKLPKGPKVLTNSFSIAARSTVSYHKPVKNTRDVSPRRAPDGPVHLDALLGLKASDGLDWSRGRTDYGLCKTHHLDQSGPLDQLFGPSGVLVEKGNPNAEG